MSRVAAAIADRHSKCVNVDLLNMAFSRLGKVQYFGRGYFAAGAAGTAGWPVAGAAGWPGAGAAPGAPGLATGLGLRSVGAA